MAWTARGILLQREFEGDFQPNVFTRRGCTNLLEFSQASLPAYGANVRARAIQTLGRCQICLDFKKPWE